jgi:hypothetical protein
MERGAQPMVDPHPYPADWWHAWRAWSDYIRRAPWTKKRKAK